MRRFVAILLLLALHAVPACAEDRDFCADRPGQGTPACTLAPGSVMVESGLLAWDHRSDNATAEDDLSFVDLLVRVGISADSEVQLGLGGYRNQRVRQQAGGAISRQSGLGDGFVALRHGLTGPNGPVAIEGFVTLPIGDQPIGTGDWGAGVLLPIGFDLPSGFEIDLTPEADAAVNASGSGRHLAWGGVIGLTHGLGRKVTVTGEVAALRDEDPVGAATQTRVVVSLAWQALPDVQVDFEADAGLTAAAPSHSLSIGVARRFR